MRAARATINQAGTPSRQGRVPRERARFGLAPVVPPLLRSVGASSLALELCVVRRRVGRVEQHLGGLVVDAETAVGRVEVGHGGSPRGPDLVRRGGRRRRRARRRGGSSVEVVMRSSPAGSRRRASARRSCRGSPGGGTGPARRWGPPCPSPLRAVWLNDPATSTWARVAVEQLDAGREHRARAVQAVVLHALLGDRDALVEGDGELGRDHRLDPACGTSGIWPWASSRLGAVGVEAEHELLRSAPSPPRGRPVPGRRRPPAKGHTCRLEPRWTATAPDATRATASSAEQDGRNRRRAWSAAPSRSGRWSSGVTSTGASGAVAVAISTTPLLAWPGRGSPDP